MTRRVKRNHTVLPATHTFIHEWNETYCLYSVSIHQVAPPERGRAHPITARCSFIDLEKIKGWVGLVKSKFLVVVLVIVGLTTTALTRCSKNVPPLACYNFVIHEPIAIIFGRNATKNRSDQSCFSPPHVTSVSALHSATGNPEIASFQLNP